MSHPNPDTTHIPAGIIGTDKKVPARLTKKFEPKTWKPLYDQFVYFHVLGKSNIWIAEKFGKTPQTVCNILNSTQGQVHKKIIAYNLQQQQVENVVARMEGVSTKFMRRIEQVADDDELFEKAPFAVVDRGLAIIKSLGHLKGGSPTDGGNNGGSTTINNTQINDNRRTVNIISEKAAQDLRDAIRFSDAANAMHSLENAEDKMNVIATAEVKDIRTLPLQIGTPIKKVG
jgi:hypothetical protein